MPCKAKKSDSVASCKTSCLQSRSSELPPHLKDLYKRSATDLSVEEAEQLYNLLLGFSDVFSEGSHDLGRTDLLNIGSIRVELHQFDSNHADYLWLREMRQLGQLMKYLSRE